MLNVMSIWTQRIPCAAIVLTLLLGSGVHGQIVWQQKMDKYSAILPLTLDNDVYRIRCKPPQDVKPSDINCDIGITGTVLTDQRGTSAGEEGQKVLSGLLSNDDIDVQFADRVFTDNHDYVGNRILSRNDFDCGINIKYQNKLKVAQVEIRLGYVLPSGDREGLTWAKLARKKRVFADNIAKCDRYAAEIDDLQGQRSSLMSVSPENATEYNIVQARLSGISRKIDQKSRFVGRKENYQRDLAAFLSLEEYLKTKINGSQVYIHFHYNKDTLPVDIEDLKRSRVRPIQVFELAKDPVRNGESR